MGTFVPDQPRRSQGFPGWLVMVTEEAEKGFGERELGDTPYQIWFRFSQRPKFKVCFWALPTHRGIFGQGIYHPLDASVFKLRKTVYDPFVD